jgi:DNA-binding beta-propeller fold protein YncE
MPASATITMVDVAARRPLADIPVPGRTRWAIFDPVTDRFYVNIAAPALMAVVDPGQPTRLTRTMEIPVAGPHGLDVDSATGRLFCACDGGEVVVLAAATGQVLSRVPISGVPDVVFLHPGRQRLYVAVGNPGVIDVLDTAAMARIRTVPTERGGKTTALDVQRHKLYVFLPQTHRAAVLVDS